MPRRLLLAVVLFAASAALADLVIRQQGTRLGPVLSLDCRSGMVCTRDGSVAYISGDGGASTGHAFAADAAGTASRLIANPNGCDAGYFVVDLDEYANPTCDTLSTADAAYAVQAGTAYSADAAYSAIVLAADPADCPIGQWARAIGNTGDLACSVVFAADASLTAVSATTAAVAFSADASYFATVSKTAYAADASLTAVSATSATTSAVAFSSDASYSAIVLAANPRDCDAGQFAHTIDVSGNLLCSAPSLGKIAEAYMADASITAAQLEADPTDCAAGSYAIAIDSTGALTCSSIPGSGVGSTGRTYYLSSDASTVDGGYRWAFATPSTNAENTLTVSLTGTGDTLFGTWVTPALNATNLAAGTAGRHFHAKVGASTQVARFKTELYRWPSDAGPEVLLRSGYSDNFTNTTTQAIEFSYVDPNAFTFATTDQIVFKVYAARVSGPATVTVTFYYEGASNASYIQTTLVEPQAKVSEAYMADASITAQTASVAYSADASHTANQLAADPAACGTNMYAKDLTAAGVLSCSCLSGFADLDMDGTSCEAWVGVATSFSSDASYSSQLATTSAVAFSADASFYAQTATTSAVAYSADASYTAVQLAADPADCASSSYYAHGISSTGALTCTAFPVQSAQFYGFRQDDDGGLLKPAYTLDPSTGGDKHVHQVTCTVDAWGQYEGWFKVSVVKSDGTTQCSCFLSVCSGIDAGTFASGVQGDPMSSQCGCGATLTAGVTYRLRIDKNDAGDCVLPNGIYCQTD